LSRRRGGSFLAEAATSAPSASIVTAKQDLRQLMILRQEAEPVLGGLLD
jgi:hypothetical protein